MQKYVQGLSVLTALQGKTCQKCPLRGTQNKCKREPCGNNFKGLLQGGSGLIGKLLSGHGRMAKGLCVAKKCRGERMLDRQLICSNVSLIMPTENLL